MDSKRSSRRQFARDLLVSGTAATVGSSLSAADPAPSAAPEAECNPIGVKSYLMDILGARLPSDTVFRLAAVESAATEDGDVIFSCSLVKHTSNLKEGEVSGSAFIRVRCLGDHVLRVLISRVKTSFQDESPMLEWDASLVKKPCQLAEEGAKWTVTADGKPRARATRKPLDIEFLPDAQVSVRMQNQDSVMGQWEALPAAFLARGDGTAGTTLSLGIDPGEHFCGTGERFDHIDLFGRQFDLVNVDALGVNSPRAYKNIPLLVSSRPYAVFIHSSARMRVDIGRHSSRSAQWVVEDEPLDFFLMGGGSLERVLWNYRRITGFPKMPPLWSFGSWMSRYTYDSPEQMYGIADRLRQEKYPFDVLHLDPGWLKNSDWHRLDWTFDTSRFPDPPAFFRHLRERGFRVSLWQAPYVAKTIPLAQMAMEKGYLGKPTDPSTGATLGYTIDFSNPEAVAWYEGMLERVLRMGAAVIKADFGEEADEKARYQNVAGSKMRNLYALLYQRSVWEVTYKVKRENIEWARAGWAGSQRYPLHWGGDSRCSFDGLAGTICGGLHLGLSGFAFWSHDTGGFLGFPDVFKDKPPEHLYARWVQVGSLTSHMRFHGTTPREPWEYPSVSGIVREWLRFRYALLPYFWTEAQACCRSGLPMFRSLVFEWPHDPAVWSISDEYMLGSALLVCPVLNDSGIRDVYLPEGKWVDFWSGQTLAGARRLAGVNSPLSRLPLFVRHNSTIPFAEPVQCTDQYESARKFSITFDDGYKGFDESELSKLIHLGIS